MARLPSQRHWFKTLRRPRRPGQPRRRAVRLRALESEALEPRTLLTGGTWTEVAFNPFDFNGTMELLTDGTVMVQGYISSFNDGVSANWYKLSPDAQGNYAGGTWSQLASMNTRRLYFASNIVQSGKLFVYGGEYSGDNSGAATLNAVNSGEIYDPVANTWTPVTTNPLPVSQGYNHFGDDPSMLLPNGNILTGYIAGPQTEIYNPTTNSWSAGGTKLHGDPSDEETWVTLPNGKMLSFDIFNNTDTGPWTAQLYDPATNSWSATGNVPVPLSSSQVTQPNGTKTAFFELGGALVLPSGKVFQIGGNGNTAIYDPASNSWTAGPQIPTIGSLGVRYGADDAPAALTTDGQVLFTADRPYGNGPTHMYDYDPVANTITDITSTLPAGLQQELNFPGPAFIDRMLALPNGQVMFNASYNDAWVFTPSGPTITVGTPTITTIAKNGSNSYTLTGTQLNGLSAGASYGDDVQSDTNYPIVRLKASDGKVYYARTTNWSLTGVLTGATPETVNFSLPTSIVLSNPVVSLQSISGVEGQPLNNVTIATFTDPNGNHTASTYTTSIDWGDGTVTTGTVSGPNASGVYTVTGSHPAVFAEEHSSLSIKVTVTDSYASYNLTVVASGLSSAATNYAPFFTQSSGTYSVADPAVIPVGGFTIDAVAGTTSSVQTVATFTDPGGAEALGDYSASIDWGDNTTSTGTISGPDSQGVFTVTGSHLYASSGTFTVKTTISHDSAPTATANSTADVSAATITTVTGVSSTNAAGSYGVGSTIIISVAFSDIVNVTGTPKLTLNSGGTASYSSGSGTKTLTFTYTVAAGQSANPLDESSTTALTLNGGTIKDQGGNPATLTLPAPGAAGSLSKSNIVIDTTAPAVTGVSSTAANGSYGVGSTIAITVAWSKPVVVTGTPKLALNSGGAASYSSGSGTSTLTFTYTVAAGQSANPLDEASATALALNGGTIFDAVTTNPNAAVLTLPVPGATGSLGKNKAIVVDTTAPAVTGVSSTTANGSYGVGSVITITVGWSEPVVVTGTPKLALNSGGTASYASGSGTGTLTFTYTVGAGQNANPLDEASATALALNGGTIFDTVTTNPNAAVLTLPAPGTSGSLGKNKAIVVDTTAPTVTAVTSTTADGTYGVGSVITITVGWSKPVVVTGTPQLALNSGGTASYSSGSGTSTLTFTYTVGAGQNTPKLDYTSTTALALNGGAIFDTVTNPNAANLTLPAPGSAGSIGGSKSIAIDTTSPTVTAVTSTTADGTYGVGSVITITVGWSEPVVVTGTPKLALNSGGTASYSSGSGTSTLTFTYTVAAGENSPKLDYTSTTALTLNGGTIFDTVTNPNAANLTLPAPGSTGSIGATKSIVIDTVPPTVLSYSVLFGQESYNLVGSNRLDLPWKITGIQVVFSKPITTGDVNSLAGLTATGLTGLGTNTLTWSINALSNGSFATVLQGTGAHALKDVAGNLLAGGVSFTQDFKVLYGDVNGDGVVSSADMSTVYYAIGSVTTIFDDLDGDGKVDMTDVQAARGQIGQKLS